MLQKSQPGGEDGQGLLLQRWYHCDEIIGPNPLFVQQRQSTLKIKGRQISEAPVLLACGRQERERGT